MIPIRTTRYTQRGSKPLVGKTPKASQPLTPERAKQLIPWAERKRDELQRLQLEISREPYRNGRHWSYKHDAMRSLGQQIQEWSERIHRYRKMAALAP
jgi:hypothetical protein